LKVEPGQLVHGAIAVAFECKPKEVELVLLGEAEILARRALRITASR